MVCYLANRRKKPKKLSRFAIILMQEEFSEDGFEFEKIERTFKNESDRKIFEKVFDKRTLKALHTLSTKELFNFVEHIISTGKEAHVFVALDKGNNRRAVKIYKTLTTDFKRMNEYIEGDERFKNLKKERRQLVFAWAKKEFKNLSVAANAHLSAPLPLGSMENVLVMEFIGENNEAAPKLRETKPTQKELKNYYGQTIDFIARLYLENLIHADLSEYNILVRNKELVFIDMAQAVLVTHPKAREFFERDVTNMASYFSKNGLETGFEGMYAAVKARKEELEKKRGRI